MPHGSFVRHPLEDVLGASRFWNGVQAEEVQGSVRPCSQLPRVNAKEQGAWVPGGSTSSFVRDRQTVFRRGHTVSPPASSGESPFCSVPEQGVVSAPDSSRPNDLEPRVFWF